MKKVPVHSGFERVKAIGRGKARRGKGVLAFSDHKNKQIREYVFLH